MSELKNIFLTIVTENQTKKIKAEKLSELLQSELGNDWEILTIEKYHKFDNSYKIELKTTLIENRTDKVNHLAISLTDKLLSPWLLYYDKDESFIELIYNKDENAKIRKIEFNVIKWGHLQITKQ
ncbi:hypothetical protein ASG01_14665 [Chryseobacterium sp. Leaf180]|uniref:hypothetical protein n=1 Tax=Chryseobacterium sp. Leaf180 TaxID=1736289 RepID=UPI0006F43EA7|nr:hypothetical protein [Chryseobacterium sp. Leaf180]KQR91121.1 hypothetical protein ASG01_14665 [Chryseobacterium sp. Leaf180]